MWINKNLDLNGLYKCCRKVCACNISLKIINDIVKGQNVILLNKVAKISVYIYIHTHRGGAMTSPGNSNEPTNLAQNKIIYVVFIKFYCFDLYNKNLNTLILNFF